MLQVTNIPFFDPVSNSRSDQKLYIRDSQYERMTGSKQLICIILDHAFNDIH